MKTLCNLFCALMLTTALAHAATPKTFEGEIADSSCAMNVHSLTHSHKEMLKSQGKYMGQDAKSCTLYCVRKMGSEYMLSNGDQIYHLDNQDKAAEFAGEKVVISGSLDPNGRMIHVESIEKKK